MAQEEETRKCNNWNSGGVNLGNIGVRSSKKQKQKKVPQRGLGVAQLEKIRLEEQQKKEGSMILISPHPISSSPPKPSVPIPTYPSSIPYFSSSPDSINMDTPASSNTFPLVNSLGWQSIFVHQGHGNALNLEKENYGVHPGLAFRSSLNFPYESNNPSWPLHSLMQRAQYHYHPAPPSMVTVSSTSSSSTSLLSFHMELPSNQNYYVNASYTSVWPEEEKMVSMKRTYPFSPDSPPDPPPFHCKFPSIIHPIGRSDESTSFGNGSTFNLIPNFREGTICCDSMSETKPNSKKSSIKENEDFNADFLTLAPPATTLSCPNSKLKRPSAYFAFQNETFDFDSLPYQGIMQDEMLQPVASVPDQVQPHFGFKPPHEVIQIGQASRAINNCNGGEVREDVDLSLKL